MNIKLDYGTEVVPVDVPDNWINGRLYRAPGLKACADVRAELMVALESLSTGSALENLAKGKKNCVIAVDPSHAAIFPELLPAFIEILEDHSSLRAADIKVLVANRVLNPFRQEDLAGLLDEGTLETCPVELHDPTRMNAVVEAGTSSKGIPITVNKSYAEADMKVLLGGVTADLLLGFTGGRGILAPGLSGPSTLQLFYSPAVVGMPGVRYGNFRDNPLHVHAMETAQAFGADIAISATFSPDGRIARIFSGHFGQSHFQAMTAVRDSMQVTAKEPMDIVVTSGGGSPRDGTLMQLTAALCAVEPILKEDGTIVVVAEIGKGIGPSQFEKLVKAAPNYEDLIELLGHGTGLIPGQWIAQHLYRTLRAHEVILYTRKLTEDEVWSVGLTPAKDINDAILGAMESHGQRCKIVALPDGPACLGGLPMVPESIRSSRVHT